MEVLRSKTSFCPNCSAELTTTSDQLGCWNCGALFDKGSTWQPIAEPTALFRPIATTRDLQSRPVRALQPLIQEVIPSVGQTARRIKIRALIFLGLITFCPLLYSVVFAGGVLTYAGIFILMFNNFSEGFVVVTSLVQLALYGAGLSWLAGVIARAIIRNAKNYQWRVTIAVLLLLAGIGLLPIFGAAGHGSIHWANTYHLYVPGNLR